MQIRPVFPDLFTNTNGLHLGEKKHFLKPWTLLIGQKTIRVRALRTEKIPPKLKLTIKPLIMKKEDLEFQAKWNQATKQAEHTLIRCLVEHLDNIMETTNSELQGSTKETPTKLKTRNSKEEPRKIQNCTG